MENVRGMLKVADQVVEDYESIEEKRNGVTYSYTVSYKILNSLEEVEEVEKYINEKINNVIL